MRFQTRIYAIQDGIEWELDPTGHYGLSSMETIEAVVESLGLLPTFLNASSDKSLREQMEQSYHFGLHEFKGCKFHLDGSYSYTEDPRQYPIALVLNPNEQEKERMYIYPDAFVAFFTTTDSNHIDIYMTRMD